MLDESDFTLAVRTQLIYPSGSQVSVDGSPVRWEIVESLLKLVRGHLFNLQQDFPQCVEVINRPNGGFPIVFLLRREVEDALTARLIADIYNCKDANLPMGDFKKAERVAIKQFLTEPKVTQQVIDCINSLFPDKPSIKKSIYLLRGLFVHRILLLCLKKRWNVQYGLHPDRDP